MFFLFCNIQVYFYGKFLLRVLLLLTITELSSNINANSPTRNPSPVCANSITYVIVDNAAFGFLVAAAQPGFVS